jgi:glycine betaine/choline ABC-type transport system substrate-binding protein
LEPEEQYGALLEAEEDLMRLNAAVDVQRRLASQVADEYLRGKGLI